MSAKTGKINRSPGEAGLDLPLDDLLWLREEWLSARKAARKIIAETKATYAQKTSYFVMWWTDYGASVDWQLAERHMLEFEAWLLGRISKYTGEPLAWHTRNDALRRIKEMLSWAHEQRMIEDVDPAAWIPVATGEPPERRAANIEQLWRVMDAAAEGRYPLRDQTILALFIGTGIRRVEVDRLEAQQIVFSADGSGTAAIAGKRTPANKSGKRTIAFDAFTGRYLIAYLDEMGIGEGPLFFNDMRGTPLSESGIYQLVKRSIRAAGLADTIQGCHDLRRAFSTILALHDADFADMLRRQLGHKHYSQTAEYTKIDADHIRERIVSPLALSGDRAQRAPGKNVK